LVSKGRFPAKYQTPCSPQGQFHLFKGLLLFFDLAGGPFWFLWGARAPSKGLGRNQDWLKKKTVWVFGP